MRTTAVAFLCKETLVSCGNLEKIYTLVDVHRTRPISNATPDDIVLRTESAFEAEQAEKRTA
jgi:hypothetical protein